MSVIQAIDMDELYEEMKNTAIKIDANGNDISSEEDSGSSTSDSIEDEVNKNRDELRTLTRWVFLGCNIYFTIIIIINSFADTTTEALS
jgi:hypothetical protein